MSIIDLALIGKLKKTKADKSNVLQLDNAGAYTPSGLYNPTTKKYVDDNVQANKLKSISDTPVIRLLDQKTNTIANDLSSYIGSASSLYAKNYDYSLFLQNQNIVFNESNLTTPLTLECWFYYLDDSASSTRIFEVGGTIPGDKAQWVELNADGSIGFTDTTGTKGGNTGGSFTPYANWVHYAMYVDQTEWCVWINGVRRNYGNFSVDVTGDYRQTVARTYVSLGSYFSAAPGFVQPFGLYDSVRVSSGDRYGKSNASITIPQLFDADASTTHLYHIDASYDANVANNLYVNTPTEDFHAVPKSYVDTAIANIPVTVDTNTYVINGNVQGTTLSLNQNNGTSVNIDVSSLLDDTTNTITSGVLSGSSILFTRQDGSNFTVDVSNLYDDTNLVTSVNGQTGSVSVPLLSSVSFNSTTNVLTANISDGGSYTADLSSLAGQTFDQSLNTTDAVHFAEVGASFGDFPLLNVNNKISFNTVSGTTDQVIVTSVDGTSSWSSLKTINGQTLIGTGNINITQAGVDKYVVSGTVSGSTLTLTNSDASTININVGALLDDTTNTVSTGVLNDNVITFTRQDNTTFQVDVSALYDDTNLVTSVNGQTGSVTIADTNDYVDGVSLSSGVLTLSRTGSLPDLTVDLSSLSGSGVSNINVFSRRETQDFTATAGQTIFSTSLGLFDVEVFYNGFKLDGEDYTIANGVITLLEAAQAGDNIEVIDYGSQDLTGETFISGSFEPSTPSLGTVWQDTRTPEPIIKIWNGTQWVLIGNVDTAYNKRVFEVTAPTSAFNAGYTVGLVEVFLNGLKLADTEYNALDGVTINLVQPAQAGDHLEIIALTPLTSGLFYSKTEVDVLISNIDLTNYYTKTEVDQMIAGAGTGSSTTSGVTSQVVDSFSTIDYRGGEYLLMVTGNSGFMSLKMLVLFNGSTALNSQYGQLGADLGTFDTLVVGDIVQVLFTPVDSSSVVQFSRTLIENLSANPTPSLPTDLNSGSGTLDLNSGSGTIDLNGTSVQGDLNSGSGTLDLNSGTGTSDLNQ